MSSLPIYIGDILSNNETLGAVDTHDFEVPLGRKWLLILGRAERDVNATFDLDFIDSDGATVMHHVSQIVAGVSQVEIPVALTAQEQRMWALGIILGGGQIVRYTWGVAQTTPVVLLQVLEF